MFVYYFLGFVRGFAGCPTPNYQFDPENCHISSAKPDSWQDLYVNLGEGTNLLSSVVSAYKLWHGALCHSRQMLSQPQIGNHRGAIFFTSQASVAAGNRMFAGNGQQDAQELLVCSWFGWNLGPGWVQNWNVSPTGLCLKTLETSKSACLYGILGRPRFDTTPSILQ